VAASFAVLGETDRGEVIYDVNLHSDSDFAAEVIESLGAQEEKTVLITDGAYASEESFEAAEENNTELVPTTFQLVFYLCCAAISGLRTQQA